MLHAVTEPAVTVCVSTRNRSELLPRLVEHLECQSIGVDGFEAVIVDNGSTDATWTVLQRLAAETSINLRVHRNEPGKGPAAGRNRAWRDARAPLCAFTDDDCTPTPDWLTAAVEGMRGRNAIGAGRILWPPSDESLMGPFSRSVTATQGNAMWGATANLVVQTAHLAEVGGFNEDAFLNVASEDTDLLFRILELGVEFVFLFDALVYHRVEAAGLRALIRDQRRWVDIPAIFARHPQARGSLLHRRFFWHDKHPRTLLLLLGAAALPVSPLAALLAGPWVHDRLCRDPIAEGRAERVVALPGRLVLDLVEVWTMARGSVKHKALVL